MWHLSRAKVQFCAGKVKFSCVDYKTNVYEHKFGRIVKMT